MPTARPPAGRAQWLAIATGLAAIAIAALGWRMWQPAAAPAAATPDVPFEPVRSTPSAAGSDSPRTAPRTPLPALPPQHGPLRERIDLLSQYARAGDPVAACRLALELNSCRAVNHRAAVSGAIEIAVIRYPHAVAEDAAVDTIAAAREAQVQSEANCGGVSTVFENDAVALLQAAAVNGTVRQRVIAALLQPDGSLLRLPQGSGTALPIDAFVTSMATQFYADHALEFLYDGYRAADPLALEGLILVHAPDALVPAGNTDVAFRLPDPYRFAGLSLLYERVYGADRLGSQTRNLLQRVLERMPPETLRELQAAVAAESRRWTTVADGTPPPAEALDGATIERLCR
jgi:hypothetical protein